MKRTLLIVVVIVVAVFSAAAQGCSDAGFCSLNYHGPIFPGLVTKQMKVKRNTFSFGLNYGIGEDRNSIITPAIVYSRKFGRSFSWDNKFTAAYITGKQGTNFNPSDWYSSLNYAIRQKNEKRRLNVLAGVKVPFTSSNTKEDGKPLPLAYQSSIGTFDFLVGGSYILNHIEINAAAQVPFYQVNKNTYFKEYAHTDFFVSTNNFRRKPDALLRLGYIFTTKNDKWMIKPNLLSIYHFGEDTYENIFGKREVIKGSSGLTINGNIIASYNITGRSALEFSVATPFVVREVRPDGLTRKLTAGIEYRFSF